MKTFHFKLAQFKGNTIYVNVMFDGVITQSSKAAIVVCRVYMCKQWQELKVFNDHTALATGVCFGQNAAFIASASMDRSLKVFSV